MFGSRNVVGAVIIPASAPSIGGEPPAEREHPRDADAEESARVGRDRRGAHAEADLREPEEQVEERDGAERDADHAEVLDREGDAADRDRPRRERAREGLRLASPDPAGQAVRAAISPPSVTITIVSTGARSIGRISVRSIEHAAEEREPERQEERAPVRHPPLHQLPGDERRERRHLPLREVDHPRRAVDQDDREREARVDPARREPADDLLPELRRHSVAEVAAPDGFVLAQDARSRRRGRRGRPRGRTPRGTRAARARRSARRRGR